MQDDDKLYGLIAQAEDIQKHAVTLQQVAQEADPGKSGKAEIDTLCGYVWPDVAANANTMKTRRQTTRKALVELAAVGWTVNEYAKGKWEISRPKAP